MVDDLCVVSVAQRVPVRVYLYYTVNDYSSIRKLCMYTVKTFSYSRKFIAL